MYHDIVNGIRVVFVTKYIQYITPASMIFLQWGEASKSYNLKVNWMRMNKGWRFKLANTGGKNVNKFSRVVGRVLNFTQKLMGQGSMVRK